MLTTHNLLYKQQFYNNILCTAQSLPLSADEESGGKVLNFELNRWKKSRKMLLNCTIVFIVKELVEEISHPPKAFTIYHFLSCSTIRTSEAQLHQQHTLLVDESSLPLFHQLLGTVLCSSNVYQSLSWEDEERNFRVLVSSPGKIVKTKQFGYCW